MNTTRTTLLAWALAVTLACAGCAQLPESAEPGTDTPGQEQIETPTTPAKPLVSYLGPEGTYTQEACGVFFEGEGTYLPQEDVAASVQALLDFSQGLDSPYEVAH